MAPKLVHHGPGRGDNRHPGPGGQLGDEFRFVFAPEKERARGTSEDERVRMAGHQQRQSVERGPGQRPQTRLGDGGQR